MCAVMSAVIFTVICVHMKINLINQIYINIYIINYCIFMQIDDSDSLN